MSKKALLDSFNLSLPIVAAPMFIVSQLELVKAGMKSGIIAAMPALNNRTTEGFDEWLTELDEFRASEKQANGKDLPPYAINLIVHKTNFRVMPDLEIIVKHKVPIVITSLGANEDVVKAVHSYGGLVFHDVTNSYHAQKAINVGVDGLILVTAGAGGHAGTLNPIPFIQEIRSMFDGIILLGGCLSNGKDVATALQMGADLAYMGTRFINTDEAKAPEAYKDMIIASGTRDIVYTAAISGVPANFLGKSLEAAGITKELWEQKVKVDFGKELDTEAKAWTTIWSAGQGSATIQKTEPMAELVAQMKLDFKDSIDTLNSISEQYTS